MHRSGCEDGIILVNVLLFVAIAAAIVAVLLVGGDAGLDRATRLRDAARAVAIAEGGELSAITAPRRDRLEAPASDDAGEAWARVTQRDIATGGGQRRLVALAEEAFRLILAIGHAGGARERRRGGSAQHGAMSWRPALSRRGVGAARSRAAPDAPTHADVQRYGPQTAWLKRTVVRRRRMA